MHLIHSSGPLESIIQGNNFLEYLEPEVGFPRLMRNSNLINSDLFLYIVLKFVHFLHLGNKRFGMFLVHRKRQSIENPSCSCHLVYMKRLSTRDIRGVKLCGSALD
jgi:hypothetical protein